MSLHKDRLLLPGLGHMELNEARILLKLLWNPLISQQASMLGFRISCTKVVAPVGIDGLFQGFTERIGASLCPWVH